MVDVHNFKYRTLRNLLSHNQSQNTHGNLSAKTYVNLNQGPISSQLIIFLIFIEVDELDNTLSSTIAQKTEAHITRHGLPDMILSDNGPQFIGTEYKQLCQKYQIQHITSSPYWPQGSGKSEASVKIFKWILKKSGKHNLNEALLLYRNTPQVGHTLTPAQRSMGRRLRCMLPTSRQLLLPHDGTSTSVTNTIAKKKNELQRNITMTPGPAARYLHYR